jgi:hypothetical protein
MSGRAALAACAFLTAGVLLGTGCEQPDRAEVVPVPLDATILATILARGGLDAVRFDETSVVLKDDRVQLLVFLEDEGTSLQAVLPYTGRRRGSAQTVAAWNAGRRFGRAYLDQDGGPVLASDLLLWRGSTATAVRSWGRLVLAMAAAFRAEVWPDQAPPGAPDDE